MHLTRHVIQWGTIIQISCSNSHLNVTSSESLANHMTSHMTRWRTSIWNKYKLNIPSLLVCLQPTKSQPAKWIFGHTGARMRHMIQTTIIIESKTKKNYFFFLTLRMGTSAKRLTETWDARCSVWETTAMTTYFALLSTFSFGTRFGWDGILLGCLGILFPGVFRLPRAAGKETNLGRIFSIPLNLNWYMNV